MKSSKMDIRISEKLKENFYSVCKKNMQTPSVVVRKLIEDFTERRVDKMSNIDRYNELLKKDNTSGKDLERKSLFHILANNEELYSKVNAIYDFEESFIKTECLDEEIDLNDSSRQLIQLAFNLYNGYESKNDDIMSLLSGLDDSNFENAIEAIKIRFGKAI